MTQKSKKLKTFLTFTILAGLLFSCQVEEEFTNPNLEQRNGKIVHKSFEELIKETEFKSAFDKMNQLKKGSSQKKGTTSKTVMENRYDFTIADYPANVIVQNTETTYTFFITRDTIVNNIYENLIVKVKPNSEPTAHIIKYRKNAIANLVNGNFNQSSEIINLTKIIYDPSQYSSLVNTEQCETLHIWICNYNPKHDENTPGCTGESGGSVTLCTGSGGDGSTTSGNNYTSYGVPNYSSSNNSYSGGSNGSNPNPIINTAPVGPPIDLDNLPCEKIKDLLDPTKADLKSAIEALQPFAGQSAGECGTSLVKNAAGTFGTNPLPPNPDGLSMDVPTNGDVYGSIHTHPIFNSAIPMFSWGDVHSLFQTYDKSAAHNGNIVTAILVVKTYNDAGVQINTTYALSISNPAEFLAKMDAELGAMTGTLEEKRREKNNNLKFYYENIGIGSKNWEKGFLNYFKDYNLSLMKANPTLTGWSELKITDDRLPINLQTVTPNPC